MKNISNSGEMLPIQVTRNRPKSALAKQRKSTSLVGAEKDDNQVDRFSDFLMIAERAIYKGYTNNAFREVKAFREVLIDLRGERVEDGNIRTFQNEAGFTITERLNGNTLRYRKKLRPNGSYVAEYFDLVEILARRLKVYSYGGIEDIVFDANANKISRRCFDSVEHWFDFHEEVNKYFVKLEKAISKI
jgi:hypothetical protein